MSSPGVMIAAPRAGTTRETAASVVVYAVAAPAYPSPTVSVAGPKIINRCALCPRLIDVCNPLLIALPCPCLHRCCRDATLRITGTVTSVTATPVSSLVESWSETHAAVNLADPNVRLSKDNSANLVVAPNSLGKTGPRLALPLLKHSSPFAPQFRARATRSG